MQSESRMWVKNDPKKNATENDRGEIHLQSNLCFSEHRSVALSTFAVFGATVTSL